MTRKSPPLEPQPTTMEADYAENEITRRRDEVVRRMLNTPYAPQTPTKPKAKKKKKSPVKA